MIRSGFLPCCSVSIVEDSQGTYSQRAGRPRVPCPLSWKQRIGSCAYWQERHFSQDAADCSAQAFLVIRKYDASSRLFRYIGCQRCVVGAHNLRPPPSKRNIGKCDVNIYQQPQPPHQARTPSHMPTSLYISKTLVARYDYWIARRTPTQRELCNHYKEKPPSFASPRHLAI